MVEGARRLARELDQPLGQGAFYCRVEQATVLSVAAGVAADGNALVTVSWAGASRQAAYLGSAPSVGHVVAVVVQPPASLLILGRVIGTPPT